MPQHEYLFRFRAWTRAHTVRLNELESVAAHTWRDYAERGSK